MFRAIAKSISKRLNPERAAAIASFRAQSCEHGALWLRDVCRRYGVGRDASAERSLTTSQLWAASRMSRAELAAL